MDQYFSNNPQSTVSSNRILYTPSTFARTSLLHLQEIGELEARRTHTSSRSELSSFLFFMVVRGKGKLEYNGKEHELSAGDCVFINCKNPYSHTTSSEKLWTLRWIHFHGPTMSSIYSKYCERGGHPVFKVKDISEVEKVWSAIMTVASGNDYMRDMLINQYLSELMVYVMRESWHLEDQDKLPRKKSLIFPVKEYLDKNYTKKINLDDLSEIFFINKYYLTKVFKEQYGFSINNYLLNLRISKAKQLLRFSDLSVEQIGMEAGIGAAHYFSKVFKDVEGVPPSVYREQW